MVNTATEEIESPLLDLPFPIIEQILERLPLPDYIRFGSICTKCHSIQKQHRISHSPLPPPMQKTFPWLIPFFPTQKGKKLLQCYCPFEQKYFPLSIPKGRYPMIFSTSALTHGWFFLVDRDRRKQITFLNPVSKSQIKLPSVMTNLSNDVKGYLSASPLSPDCVAIILDRSGVFLYRLLHKQTNWTLLSIPDQSAFHFFAGIDGVYCNGKFYCIAKKLFVIDLVLTTPTISELNMDCSQLSSDEFQFRTLVELNGEILLVVLISYRNCKRFEVFKADFSTMKWIKLNNIGDHVLFATSKGSFSMLANDMDCKSNCVYFIEDRYLVEMGKTWSVFDMDTLKWSDGPLSPYKDDWDLFEQWFLPSLDCKILLVVLISYQNGKRYEVFKADFSTMMWVKLNNIGDHVLFATSQGSFSMLANDVDCKSNYVHFIEDRYLDELGKAWGVFDMDTMKSSEGPSPYNDGWDFLEQRFLPSLDCNVRVLAKLVGGSIGECPLDKS